MQSVYIRLSQKQQKVDFVIDETFPDEIFSYEKVPSVK